MNYLILILILFTIESKALVVHKCILKNGTISYQKEPYIEDTTTIKENQLKSKSKDELIAEISKKLDQFSINLKSYSITLVTVKNWRVFKKRVSDNFLHLKFVDDSKGSEMSLLIDFVLPKNNKAFSEQDLKKLVVEMGRKMLIASIQKSVTPEAIKVKEGVGVVANFTDKLLVNKSSYPPGEYLNTTIGLIYKNGFYIHFTLLSNNKESLNHIMAYTSMTSGIEISKLKNVKPKKESTNPLDKPYSNYQNGNKRESVAMFERVIKELPENFEAWIGYCLALRDTNRLQTAFIACDKALSLNPKNPEIYNSLINLYTEAREWEYGIQFIEKVVPKLKNENLINGITNLGYYSMIDNNLNVAERAFKVVKDIGSIEPRLDVDIASLNYLQGNKEKAINILNSTIKANPDYKFANAVLTLIKVDEFSYDPNLNKKSYQKIPKRLLQLGYSKNIKQKPDQMGEKILSC